MPNRLIGRRHEKALLEGFAQSNKPEFVAIYGRRRVGKTFLVNQVFSGRLMFSMTGVLEGDRRVQMHTFMDAIDLYGYPLQKLLPTGMRLSRRCVIFSPQKCGTTTLQPSSSSTNSPV